MQRKQPANDDHGPTNDHDPLAINETTTGKQRPAPRTIDDQRPGRPRKSTSGAHHGPQTTNDPTSQLGHVAVGDVATTRHRRTTTMSSSVYIGYAVDRPLAIDGQHPPHHHATPPRRKGHAARQWPPHDAKRPQAGQTPINGVERRMTTTSTRAYKRRTTTRANRRRTTTRAYEPRTTTTTRAYKRLTTTTTRDYKRRTATTKTR